MKIRTIILISASIIIIAAVIFFITGMKRKYSFTYARITRGNIENTIASTGNLQFAVTNNVNSLDAGTIVRIYTDFNKKIYKGQVMAKIDDTTFKATLDQMTANLHSVEAVLSQAQQNYNDTKSLFDQSFTSQSNLDAAKNTLDSAKAQVEVAKAQVETAQLNLSNTEVIAPLTGIVVQRNIDVGNAVGSLSYAGPPLFVIAADTMRMQIMASVAESDIGVVRRGDKARFTLQAYMDKTFEGVVSDIYMMPALVQNVVNYSVIINIDNSKGLFYPGMTATIDIVTDLKTNVLELPNSVLKFRPTPEMFRQFFTPNAGNRPRNTVGGNNYTNQPNTSLLLIYNEDTGKIQPVRVKTGMTDGQMTEIESDRIKEGMLVVSGVSNQGPGGQGQQSASPFQGAFPGGRGMGR